MLENDLGARLKGIRTAPHWRVFSELLQEASLRDPLLHAVEAYVNAVVASQGAGGTGQQVAINSTAAGPSIFGQLSPQWETSYAQWLANLCNRQPELPDNVEARQIEGMAIWYVLAELRPDERWLAPPNKTPRVYNLLGNLRTSPA